MATERLAIDPFFFFFRETHEPAILPFTRPMASFKKGVASRSSNRTISAPLEDRLERGADRSSHSRGTSILFRLSDLAKRFGVQTRDSHRRCVSADGCW